MEDSDALVALAEGEGEENEFVEEAEELKVLVQRVVDSDGKDAAAVYDRYRIILYKYQEQSQLLDALLEDVVQPLSVLLRRHAIGNLSDESLKAVQDTCRLLNVLVIVRGYKTVVRFFPHEASDLEAVLGVLTVVKNRAAKIASSEEGIATWEAQNMLLLWLSILILIPFELATVDSAAAMQAEHGPQPYTVLVGKVLALCQEYLQHPGSVREMAALLLGRLLTRPDMSAALTEFLTWCEAALKTTDGLKAPFLVPGVLQALCFIFKLGQRARLLPYTPRVWALLTSALPADGEAQEGVGASGVLSRKLCIKLVQRLGLTFLEPRMAPWRYVKQDASLDVTLGTGAAAAGGDDSAAAGGGEDEDEGDDDDEIEIVEEIEEVVERLLAALRDKDTVVRWSAAKGIGRITGCLPKALGDDIVGSVLELFRPTESDTAWHGGCLALAELARRGLLLPERLPALAPICQRALLYDVRRGPHSIGAHVRDAAAYVCWAFARAYSPSDLEACVSDLASTLLVGACYDREVNCRRAGAAAFQEAVGRLGNFPHGIDILVVADYFSVGNINTAYTRVAPFIARYPEYSLPLANHLIHVKLRHWEKSLRELAAAGAAALVGVPACGQYMAAEGLDTLLPLCLDSVLEVRHGAVVGVAALLPALKAAGVAVSEERLAQIAGLVPAIDKARLYRGKGGEVMREAVSKLVRAGARAGLPLNAAQHGKVLEALDENLRHPQDGIQQAAVLAVQQYARTYVRTAEEVARFGKFLSGYMSRLHDPNVAVRRGYALALGVMPSWLLAPQAQQVLDALIDGTVIEEDVDDRDVDSRVNCVKSLARVCVTLLGAGAGSAITTGPAAAGPGSGEEEAAADAADAAGGDAGAPAAALPAPPEAVQLLLTKVLPCLREQLQDYTTDNRGDVGSHVREASMTALVQLCELLQRNLAAAQQQEGQSPLPGLLTEVVGQLLKQGVERIARVRSAATRLLRQLLAQPALAGALPAAAAVAAALPVDQVELTGVASLEAVPRLARLMAAHPDFVSPLLEGLVAAVGGMDAQLSKAAGAVLVEVLAAPAPSPAAGAAAAGGVPAVHQAAAQHFVGIWRRHAKSGRMAGPLLRTADLLATKLPELLLLTVSPAAPAAAEPQQPQPLADVLVELARAETRQCSDVARLVDASTLLCHLLPCPNPCRTSAYQGLLVLLVSRFPKVRRHAAEQLYLQLLTLEASEVGASGVTDEVSEQAQDVLLCTSWDGDLDTAKAARNEFAQLVGVAVPAMRAAANAGGAKKGVADEYASYQSLLDDFARGY